VQFSLKRHQVSQDLHNSAVLPCARDRRVRHQRSAQRLLAAGLALAVGALLWLGFVEGDRSAGLRVGIVMNDLPTGLVVTHVTAGGPADQAGMKSGDVILTVQGVAISDNFGYDAVAVHFEPRKPVVYQVKRGNQTVVLNVQPGVPLDWGLFIGGVLASLAYLALALVVAAQARQDVRTRLLFWFSAAVAMELALPSLPVIGRPAVSALADLGFYLATGVQIGLELHLVSVLPEPPEWLHRRRWIVAVYYAVGLTIGATLLLLYTCDFFGWPFVTGDTSAIRSILLLVVMPLWAMAVIGMLGWKAIHHPEPSGRHRAALVLLGNSPWAIFIIATTALDLSNRPWPTWMERIEPLILLCFPVAVFFAISRYHLFDIEFVVRRSMIYAALTGTLLLLFYIGVGAGSVLFSEFVSGGASVWIVAIATLILGLAFTPLRQALQGLIDRRFFPERHAMRQRLTGLAGELAALGKLSLMGNHLVHQLREIFGLSSATLLVADPRSGVLLTLASTRSDLGEDFGLSFLLSPDDAGVRLLKRSHRALPAHQLIERSASLAQRLHAFDVAVMVPVIRGGTVIALLLLGPKASGQRYLAEEMDLLNLLAQHVATVLENARLFASATYDSLTGLLRREAILDLLDKELHRALRYRRPLTVGMADLDHFKETNDLYGHLVGDALLNRVAQALQGGLRSTDAIGRYGGEEFLLVLPETDLAGATAVAEKMRAIVEGVSLPIRDTQTIPVTVSIGLATVGHGKDAAVLTVMSLIAEADRNLFRAKQAGRNRVEPAPGPI